LIETLKIKEYNFFSLREYFSDPNSTKKFIIIRHDVERKIQNAKKMAALEAKLNIHSTYYFRYPNTFDAKIIKEIQDLGHEVGYHYETLAKAGGDFAYAIELFKKELAEFRKKVFIETISPHGSPLSKWNNKKIWEKFDFNNFGIIGDAALSVNFSEILYLTDTGRGWNREKVNFRDKSDTKYTLKINDIYDIIKKIKNGEMSHKAMINIHPHRWNDNFFQWSTELVWQNTKNIIKQIIIRYK